MLTVLTGPLSAFIFRSAKEKGVEKHVFLGLFFSTRKSDISCRKGVSLVGSVLGCFFHQLLPHQSLLAIACDLEHGFAIQSYRVTVDRSGIEYRENGPGSWSLGGGKVPSRVSENPDFAKFVNIVGTVGGFRSTKWPASVGGQPRPTELLHARSRGAPAW